VALANIPVAAALVVGATAMAATEETKREAINDGLVWLIGQQVVSGDEGYWPYAHDGTLATTAAAALAFIEEGFLPGEDVIIGIPPDTVNYGDVVGPAVNYIFNRATVDPRFGVETGGYWRYAEDYNNDGIAGNDGGNDQAIYFEPGAYNRRLYTTGICTPVVFALGQASGMDVVIDRGSAAVNGRTYAEVMQDLVDWICFAQVEPTQGNQRGGWRYDANWSDSDNSTAQWGSLPLLYADAWGLPTPDYVYDELELWVNYIQNANGGSGYMYPWQYVNVAKTGGLLLELAALGADITDSRVQNALSFINSRWNNGPSGTWYGNLNHPYAMWAVYKGLEVDVYELMETFWSGDPPSLIRYGLGMPAAPGGFEIGRVGDTQMSLPGDWYSHYCQYLVDIQNANGSWSGYWYWTGPLATAWYINILKASGGVPGLADPDIQITSIIDGVCVWYGTTVTHNIRYWFGTPGYPDPDIPPAQNVEVRITLDPQLIFVSATGDYSWDGAQTVVWTRDLVQDGEEFFETIVTEGACTIEPLIELITFGDISATNLPPAFWDHDESRVMTCTPLDVHLDIKPGSCPNSFNRNSNGVLPVALVGTDDIQAMEVDISTLRLEREDGIGGSVAPHEGPPGPYTEIEDVATPFPGEPCDCHELDGDGIMDVSMKFKTQDVVDILELDDLAPGDLVELVLSGQLLDGTLFAASDCIRLVPPGTPPGLLSVSGNAPGMFVDLAPLDLQLDGGGFDSFERSFPLGTVVTLTAPERYQGQALVGWKLGPDWGTAGSSSPPLPGQTISLTVSGNHRTAEAVYRFAADINGDGTVGVSDLLLLLGAWGQCPDPLADCPADIDGDGDVGVTDFLALLANWGPCP
jgi:hypothetical protein